MASVVMDITTRGLDEAIKNVQGAKDLITAGTSVRMQRWYNAHMKKTMLDIIESGEGIADNVGRYKIDKESKHGVSHGLGFLTGGLYFAVSTTQHQLKRQEEKK